MHHAHIPKPSRRPSRRLRPRPLQLPQRRAQLIRQIIARILNARPSLGIDIEHPEIIEPGTAIVSPEEVHATGVADDDAVVLAAAWFFVGEDLDSFPGVGVEGEGVEVV